jgi:hypothetical protein
MPLERVTQHSERGLVALPPWAWGKPRLGSWLVSYTREIQAIEDLLWAILDIRTLATADHTRLVVIGQLIGLEGFGFTDANLRLLIRAQALASRSDGSLRAVGGVMLAILGAVEDFAVYWLSGASAAITALTPLDAEQIRMLEQVIPVARAAGVGLQLGFSGVADPFIWGVSLWGDDGWGSVRQL